MKKFCLLFFVTTFWIFNSNAESLNVLDLLKKHLGDSIVVNGQDEIWYCPDSTCEIYRAGNPNGEFSGFSS